MPAAGTWSWRSRTSHVRASGRRSGPGGEAARQLGVLPDRVLPMLPEALSNGLCSLRRSEDRACLAVHLWYDRRGRKLRHRFERALMRSRARLTYERVQAAADGASDGATALLDGVIRPLYAAYAVLAKARRRRGTLDLDLPEAEVRLGPDGRPQAIVTRPRLDAHRLIEEFMIAANVAAAETLDQAGMHCIPHPRCPDPVKLEALAQLLQSLGMGRGQGTLARPADLSRLLEQLKEHELSPVVSQLVLRARARRPTRRATSATSASISAAAPFASPIRRYADLVVHRALISALRLGEDGLEESVTLDELQTLAASVAGRAGWKPSATRSAASRRCAAGASAARSPARSPACRSSACSFVSTSSWPRVWCRRTLGEPFTYDPARQALIARFTGTALALGGRVESS